MNECRRVHDHSSTYFLTSCNASHVTDYQMTIIIRNIQTMERKECLSGLFGSPCACKMHGRSLVYRQENKSRHMVSENKQTILLRTFRAINISKWLTFIFWTSVVVVGIWMDQASTSTARENNPNFSVQQQQVLIYIQLPMMWWQWRWKWRSAGGPTAWNWSDPLIRPSIVFIHLIIFVFRLQIID